MISLFKAFVLTASMQLGSPVLPVVPEESTYNYWAQVCNSCEVRTLLVSKALLDYAATGEEGVEYMRLVARHEVCHVALGHDAARMQALTAEHGYIMASAQVESDANACMRQHWGYTTDGMDAADRRARDWYFGGGK